MSRSLVASLLVASCAVASSAQAEEKNLEFIVRAHVEGGHEWSWTTQGDLVGSMGENRRLEAFSVHQTGGWWKSCATLHYRAHVEDSGLDIVQVPPGVVGTKGEGRRIEEVAFWFEGSCAGAYVVEYDCHLEGTGTTGRVHRNGEPCGTRGQSRRLEGFWLRAKML